MPSACSISPPVGQGLAAVEDADVVEAQEAALEDVAAFRVLPVDPPGEIQHQLEEEMLEEDAIAARRAASSRSCTRERRPRRGPAG